MCSGQFDHPYWGEQRRMRPRSSCQLHCSFHHYVERELLPAKDVEENMQKQIVSVQFLSIIVLVESMPLGEIGYDYNLRSGHRIKVYFAHAKFQVHLRRRNKLCRVLVR
jgi:hypothetical protein